jgi:hypothetical protein
MIDHEGLTSGVVCGIIVIESKIGVERLFNKAFYMINHAGLT